MLLYGDLYYTTKKLLKSRNMQYTLQNNMTPQNCGVVCCYWEHAPVICTRGGRKLLDHSSHPADGKNHLLLKNFTDIKKMTRHHVRSILKSTMLWTDPSESVENVTGNAELERENCISVYSSSTIALLLINLHTHKNNPEISLCFYVLFRINYMERQAIACSKNISS